MTERGSEDVHPLVSVLITTKDRPEDLEVTLGALCGQTYPRLEIIVLDDGSSRRSGAIADDPRVSLVTKDISEGYIKARNELMACAQGEYFVHLDDDANWVDPNALGNAIELMEQNAEIGAFAFRVHEDLEPPRQGGSAAGVEEVRSFVGCGHIIRREAFEKLGPLKEDFEFYCEEIDFCLKLWDAGYSTIRDNGLIVHHRVDWAHRDGIRRSNERDHAGHLAKYRRVRLGTRNELWWITERVPALLVPIWVVNKVTKLWWFHRKRGFHGSVVRGVGDWLRLLPRILRTRRPVRMKTFRYWIRLPA